MLGWRGAGLSAISRFFAFDECPIQFRIWPHFTSLALLARFLEKVRVDDDGCWRWTGSKRGVYGQLKNSPESAHRTSVRWSRGDIPAGLVVDHLCRHPECVRPDHLDVTTHFENVTVRADSASGRNFRKTHCKRGHPFTLDNTITRKHTVRGRTRPARECRECNQSLGRLRAAKYKARKRAASAGAPA